MAELHLDFWRRCSSCKNPIKYSAKYYVCSVSTCNRKRVGYVFDSVHCWERHLPGARHKDAAAVEAISPSFAEWKAELGPDAEAPRVAGAAPQASPRPVDPMSSSISQHSNSSPQRYPQSSSVAKPTMTAEQQASAVAAARSPQRVILGSPTAAPKRFNDSLEAEILVVVSKMKNYVKERGDMNTSDSVSNLLSDRIRRLCDRAIENARADGRKTIMDRDFDR